MVDPHYLVPEAPCDSLQGPFSIFRRCLYGKDVFEHVLDYGQKFMKAYKEDKKLLYLEFLD